MSPNQPDVALRGFLEAAGRSLAEAQGTLAGDVLVQRPALAIADAELDVKAALSAGADGQLALRPLSAADVVKGGIDPALLSSVRIRYVAVGGETAGGAPTRRSDEVVGEVGKRPDLVRLREIIGEIRLEAAFVPDKRRWLVTARDPAGRVVRELVVPDEEGGRR